MVKLYCAGCGDRLRPTTIFRWGVIRADVVDRQYRHTTRRWDNRYRTDIVTRPQLFSEKAARRRNGGPRWATR